MPNSGRRIAGVALAVMLMGCASPPMVTDPPARDANGRIHRSRAAIAAFKAGHLCPSTGRTYGACPGFTIDHIRALACGGADTPENMQYQTTEDAKVKDRWELDACK